MARKVILPQSCKARQIENRNPPGRWREHDISKKATLQGWHHAPRQMTEGWPPRPTVTSKKGRDRDKLRKPTWKSDKTGMMSRKPCRKSKCLLATSRSHCLKFKCLGMTLKKSCWKSDKPFGSFRRSHRKPECRVCTPGRPCSKGVGCFLLRDSRHSTAGFHAETGPRSVPR